MKRGGGKTKCRELVKWRKGAKLTDGCTQICECKTRELTDGCPK